MRKEISIIITMLCMLSSPLLADAPLSEIPTSDEVSEEGAAPTVINAAEGEPIKHVGQASVDATTTSRTSTAAKYILASGAVAIGVAAIILISRHSGHHSHH